MGFRDFGFLRAQASGRNHVLKEETQRAREGERERGRGGGGERGRERESELDRPNWHPHLTDAQRHRP